MAFVVLTLLFNQNFGVVTIILTDLRYASNEQSVKPAGALQAHFQSVTHSDTAAPLICSVLKKIRVTKEALCTTVYDASGNLRFESDNWPMARSALDLVIQEAQESDCPGDCPRLEIYPF